MIVNVDDNKIIRKPVSLKDVYEVLGEEELLKKTNNKYDLEYICSENILELINPFSFHIPYKGVGVQYPNDFRPEKTIDNFDNVYNLIEVDDISPKKWKIKTEWFSDGKNNNFFRLTDYENYKHLGYPISFDKYNHEFTDNMPCVINVRTTIHDFTDNSVIDLGPSYTNQESLNLLISETTDANNLFCGFVCKDKNGNKHYFYNEKTLYYIAKNNYPSFLIDLNIQSYSKLKELIKEVGYGNKLECTPFFAMYDEYYHDNLAQYQSTHGEGPIPSFAYCFPDGNKLTFTNLITDILNPVDPDIEDTEDHWKDATIEFIEAPIYDTSFNSLEHKLVIDNSVYEINPISVISEYVYIIAKFRFKGLSNSSYTMNANEFTLSLQSDDNLQSLIGEKIGFNLSSLDMNDSITVNRISDYIDLYVAFPILSSSFNTTFVDITQNTSRNVRIAFTLPHDIANRSQHVTLIKTN